MSILKNLRTEKNKENNINITQEKLAEELLVAPQTVQLWERTDNISRRNLEALISFYGLSQKECDDLVFSLYRITIDPTNKNEYVKGSINANYAMEMIANDKEGISVIFDDTKTFRHLVKETNDAGLCSVGPANIFAPCINPWKIPKDIPDQWWIDNMIDLFSIHYAFDKFEKNIFSNAVYELYEENGVMDDVLKYIEDGDFTYLSQEEKIKRSSAVNFSCIYKKIEEQYFDLECDAKHPSELQKNKTMSVLSALEPFSRPYSIEYDMYGQSRGVSIDECFLEKYNIGHLEFLRMVGFNQKYRGNNRIIIFEEIKNYKNPILSFIKDAIIQYCNICNTRGIKEKISIYSTVDNYTMADNILPYHHVFVTNEKEYLSDQECRIFMFNRRIESLKQSKENADGQKKEEIEKEVDIARLEKEILIRELSQENLNVKNKEQLKKDKELLRSMVFDIKKSNTSET